MFYIKNKKLIAKNLAGELIIFDAMGNKIITLNSSGKHIWKYLWKQRGDEEIYKGLAKRYSLPERSVIKDVNRFLKKALRHKIVLEYKH